MLSLITNSAAVNALSILRQTTSERDDAQMRVITGYRVATAADDNAYWSIATTMRSDNRTLSSVQDALGMAAAVTDTAIHGMDSSVEILAVIGARLAAAMEPGIDLDKINTELTALKGQLRSIADSSSFSGQNWLLRSSTADDADRRLVGGFSREKDGQVRVLDLTYNISGSPGTTDVNFLVDDVDGSRGILTSTAFAASQGASKNWVLLNGKAGPVNDEIKVDKTTTTAEIQEMMNVVQAMTDQATNTATRVGAIGRRVDLQHEYSLDLSDSIKFGVGRLVDADMDEEAGRLKAFQVRTELGQVSLAVANSSAETFLQLLKNG